MAVEIRDFTVTIPAGTAVAAGFTSDLSFPARVVTEIHVRVPPGPRGEVGFALGSGGVQIVPYGSGSWIVTDNEDLIFPLDDTITSGAWQLLGYNTGSFPHTLRIYFYCQLVTAPAPGSGTSLLPPGTISSGGGTGPVTSPPPVTPPVTPPPVTAPPPVTPPPAVTPPGIGTPLLLPPVMPGAPGSGGGGAVVPDALLIAVSSAGTVGLLAGGGFYPLSVQADVNALSGAGIAGVQADAGLAGALAAGAPYGTVGASLENGAAHE